MKKSEQAYYDKYFERNWNNIKNLLNNIKNLSNGSSSTIILQPTDKEEIANIISSLNSNKASGPSSIPYRILFLLKNEISKQLAYLFNLSFTTGVFPFVFKTAKVVPVFKKDSKFDYSNYRQISLFSDIEKILEKHMYERLIIRIIFLNKNNVIYNLQFGFRQQYSASHALINITENIRKVLDCGNISCGIFVDLKKAFDTVDHQILLVKLNHFGIHEVSNDWFKSYFSKCNQYVSINGYESGLSTLDCGVPQGSALGPLLFLLYINDLNQAIKFYKVHHFADDSSQC